MNCTSNVMIYVDSLHLAIDVDAVGFVDENLV